jgi:plastocyanin
MRRLAIFAPFITAAVIAGCGSSSSSSSAPSSSGSGGGGTAAATGGDAVSLSETEFKITPTNAKVSSTGTISIKVTNNGSITHALAVKTPSGVVKTSAISPGQSATLKVNASKAGSYAFYCPIGHHRQAGMRGILVVGGSSASAGGGSSSGQTSSSSSSSSNGGSSYAY